MAEQEASKRTCPTCTTGQALVLTNKSNLRARPQTGNLQTDLTPISTTLLYKCQNQACGHEWTETIGLSK